MSDVNSENYWNKRFEEDWDENSGHEQSVFFMNLALEMLPEWLRQRLNTKGSTLLDWGCAEGDGTVLLAEALPKCQIEGIDFADAAIATANERYTRKNLEFMAVDLLTQPHDKKYDVVFSSNVFEHFTDTWKIFDKVSTFASDLVVMMIPFNEDPDNLIHEHFHSFNRGDFKLSDGKWEIVHFTVRDVSRLPKTYWVGHQAMIVFARKGFAAEAGLTFADVDLSADKGLTMPGAPLPDAQQELETLRAELAHTKGELEHNRRLLSSKRIKVANKVADLAHRVVPARRQRS